MANEEIKQIKIGDITYNLHDTTARSWIDSTAKKNMFRGYNNINSNFNNDVDRNNPAPDPDHQIYSTYKCFRDGGAILKFSKQQFVRNFYTTITKSDGTVIDTWHSDTVTDADNTIMVPTYNKEKIAVVLIIGTWFARYELRKPGNLQFGVYSSNSEPSSALEANAATEVRMYGPTTGYSLGNSGLYHGVITPSQISSGTNLYIYHACGGSAQNLAKSTYLGLSLRVLYFGGYA